jgi:VanZ family protein
MAAPSPSSSHRPARWALVAAVAGAILVASLVPAGSGIGRLGPLGLLRRDLWLHGGAYLVLQLALSYAVLGERGTPAIPLAATPVLTLAYGLFVEGLQALVAYRSFSTADLVANTVGVLLAVACVLLGRWVFSGRTGP